MLKKIRMTLGSLFMIGLTLLFLDFTGTLHHYLAREASGVGGRLGS